MGRQNLQTWVSLDSFFYRRIQKLGIMPKNNSIWNMKKAWCYWVLFGVIIYFFLQKKRHEVPRFIPLLLNKFYSYHEACTVQKTRVEGTQLLPHRLHIQYVIFVMTWKLDFGWGLTVLCYWVTNFNPQNEPDLSEGLIKAYLVGLFWDTMC